MAADYFRSSSVYVAGITDEFHPSHWWDQPPEGFHLRLLADGLTVKEACSLVYNHNQHQLVTAYQRRGDQISEWAIIARVLRPHELRWEKEFIEWRERRLPGRAEAKRAKEGRRLARRATEKLVRIIKEDLRPKGGV